MVTLFDSWKKMSYNQLSNYITPMQLDQSQTNITNIILSNKYNLPGYRAGEVTKEPAVDVDSVVVKSQHSRAGSSLQMAQPAMANSHNIVPTQNIPIHLYDGFIT